MNQIAKQAPTDHSSPFQHLPDEITLHILTKLTDLKTLYRCELVCKRFSRFVRQADSISFTAPSGLNLHDLINGTSVHWKSFKSAARSMKKFRLVKSLCIELSPSIYNGGVDDHILFKCSHIIESYVFLSPNSVLDTKGLKMQSLDNDEDQEQDVELNQKKVQIARECLKDSFERFKLLVNLVNDFPALEEVYIRDSSKIGMVSVSGGRLTEIRKWFSSFSRCEGIKGWLPATTTYLPCVARRCYVLVLELRVSGYVMKGVTLVYFESRVEPVENDSFLDYGEGVEFDDKDDAAYIEAVMEIFKKHWGKYRGGYWIVLVRIMHVFP